VPLKINNKTAAEPLFKNCKMTVDLFIDRRLRVELVLECNNEGLKKLSSFVRTVK
jgi:hypothetical protein